MQFFKVLYRKAKQQTSTKSVAVQDDWYGSLKSVNLRLILFPTLTVILHWQSYVSLYPAG